LAAQPLAFSAHLGHLALAHLFAFGLGPSCGDSALLIVVGGGYCGGGLAFGGVGKSSYS